VRSTVNNKNNKCQQAASKQGASMLRGNSTGSGNGVAAILSIS